MSDATSPHAHRHHWNPYDTCADPACHAARCHYLFQIGSRPGGRKVFARCSQAAGPSGYCERHAVKREDVA